MPPNDPPFPSRHILTSTRRPINRSIPTTSRADKPPILHSRFRHRLLHLRLEVALATPRKGDLVAIPETAAGVGAGAAVAAGGGLPVDLEL